MAQTPEDKKTKGEAFIAGFEHFCKTSEALLKKAGGKHFAGDQVSQNQMQLIYSF